MWVSLVQSAEALTRSTRVGMKVPTLYSRAWFPWQPAPYPEALEEPTESHIIRTENAPVTLEMPRDLGVSENMSQKKKVGEETKERQKDVSERLDMERTQLTLAGSEDERNHEPKTQAAPRSSKKRKEKDPIILSLAHSSAARPSGTPGYEPGFLSCSHFHHRRDTSHPKPSFPAIPFPKPKHGKDNADIPPGPVGSLTLLPSLECSGMTIAHYSLDFLGSSHAPTSASQVARTTEMGSHCAAQAGLKLLALSDPPASASENTGIIGVDHHVWQAHIFLEHVSSKNTYSERDVLLTPSSGPILIMRPKSKSAVILGKSFDALGQAWWLTPALWEAKNTEATLEGKLPKWDVDATA
ncbi:hypothetical protein AAY473_034554 [Plecturocebus cupreus]